MLAAIDADTHIIESEAVWEFFDEGMAKRKPVLIPYRDPATDILRSYWIIDGHLVPKPQGKGGQSLAAPPVEAERLLSRDWRTRALLDLESRLEDADKMGVEVQVVYPTLFIGYLTDDVPLEVALCRSYNRFQADVWSRGHGRFRWVIAPPLRDIEATIAELHYGKEHGAVGVLFRGIEKDRSLADPYFFPVYEEAQQLGLPICVHTGPGCPAMTEMFDSTLSAVFPHVRLLPVMAFHDLVSKKVPEHFPDLKFGFIEANSSWVPFLSHFMNRKFKTGRAAWGPELFRNYRLYVACEADEDIPYILQYTGEEHMISGSDYGHQDQSAEPQLVHLLRAREDVSPDVMDKILTHNPKRFYGL